MAAVQPPDPGPSLLLGLRADERDVRLLFVEHSPDYASLVLETLEVSVQARFDVCCAPRLETLDDHGGLSHYDALLLDLTSNAAADDAIESAARLASRLPVIVLTGSADDAPPSGTAAPTDEAGIRERLAASRLPGAIVRAVRRHRRLGQQAASEPIVLRDPLRALAKLFAGRTGARAQK